ncbi:RluA family pseudouridine synthase [Fusobacteria bacterium ZRK30]|nr:RluA family pseudouridine synthase [Fusobacteria bacterium ZRK30]
MREIKEVLNLKAEIEDKGTRLDAFLSEKIEGYTKSYTQKLVEDGLVEIVGKKKTRPGNKLKGNEEINVTVLEDEVLDVVAEDIPLDIVYEDEHIVIINKKPDMVIHPAAGHHSGTLVNAIMHHIKDLSTISGVIRPGIVHRLDKNTSGLIIVAKTNEAHLKLTEMFKDKTIKKTYLAICKGNLKNKEGRIENQIGRDSKDRKKMTVVRDNGRTAITNYKVINEVEYFSLVEVDLETGRTHQIRVHMKYLNHSILGDDVYGKASKKADRQMLHAYKLEFNHPVTGEKMEIIGDLPEDFKKVMKKLGLEFNG